MAPKRKSEMSVTPAANKASKKEAGGVDAADPLAKLSIRQLRALLLAQEPPQFVDNADKKGDLVKRAAACRDGGGALAACPACKRGALSVVFNKKAQADELVCQGYVIDGYKLSCAYSSPGVDRHPREPWKDVEPPELARLADEADAAKEAAKEAAAAAGPPSVEASPELVAALAATDVENKAAADLLVAECTKLRLPLPTEGARQAVGAALMSNRKEGGGFDAAAALGSLAEQYPPEEKATAGATPAVVAENARIADVIREVSSMYFKEGDIMKGSSYKKAEGYLRGCPFEITSGKQVSVGKQKLPTVGKGIAGVIDEVLETGTTELLTGKAEE